MTPNQTPEARPSEAFQVEEYKQVLKERHFVMTRFMQAVGLYLALSGFALKALVQVQSIAIPRVVLLVTLFTILNTVALYVARRFKDMATHALKREFTIVERHNLTQSSTLFWGYYAGVVLVCVSEIAILTVLALDMLAPGSL
jgi:hypothetical protein